MLDVAPEGPKRLYFSTARLYADHELTLAELTAAFKGDLVIRDKQGQEVVRRPCDTLPCGLSADGRGDLGIKLEPDNLESVQLPAGLTVIFDCKLDPAPDRKPFLEEFIFAVAFRGAGEPVPFTQEHSA